MSHASRNVSSSHEAEARQERFLAITPTIEAQARYAFRRCPGDRREELVQEVVANAWTGFLRLCELGKEDLVYPTPLAQYAIARLRWGRRMAASRNVFDVCSEYGQRKNGLRLERLDRYDPAAQRWQEIVVEDKRATPAEVATTRVDFSAWLETLSSRKRKMVDCLAAGESTSTVAGMFGVTPGRISQIRRELAEAWRTFQGGDEPGMTVA